MARPLARKELPAEGMVSGKMIDNIMINGLYEDKRRKDEKRLEWRMLSLQ